MSFTNNTNIPLSMAVYLANDNYDHNPNPNVISATALLKPLKAIIIARSIPIEGETDLASLIASKVGSSIHDGIETTWRTKAGKALKQLGYPEAVWSNIKINPGPKERDLGDNIDVFMEVRGEKALSNGWVVSGKFDFVAEGQLEDFKSKKVWAWIFRTKEDEMEFILQGSIYRWLHPEIITKDTIAIDYLFTDWKANDAKRDKTYPQSQIIQRKYPLMSEYEIEMWLLNRTDDIKRYTSAKQKDMPQCTKEELWQKDPVFKYYKNPAKMTKSTKNFKSLAEANARLSQEGVGIVKEFKGEVKRCHYCSASPACLQRESLELSGLLKPL